VGALPLWHTSEDAGYRSISIIIYMGLSGFRHSAANQIAGILELGYI
jgi:hypothetical protein